MNENKYTEPSLCIIAGEASGDLHASLILPALRLALANKGYHKVNFFGAAGPLMRQEGVECIVPLEELAIMGFAELISFYPKISSAYKKLSVEIRRRKCIGVLLIDYPGFNLRFARDAFEQGQTVLYHIPPKVWAHGEKRVHQLRKYTDIVTSILPFEIQNLKKHLVAAQFVGNPLKDSSLALHREMEKSTNPSLPESSFEELTTEVGKRCKVGLIPGSRNSEVHNLFPTLIKAFAALQSRLNLGVRAVVPVARTLSLNQMKSIAYAAARSIGKNEDWIETYFDWVHGCAGQVLGLVDYAWICSGTATLEAVFFQTPMSIVFKAHPISYWIGKSIIKVPFIGLPNLCAGKLIVPEFIQHEFSVENLLNHAEQVLKDSAYRQQMKRDLAYVSQLFPADSSKNAANVMADLIKKLDVDFRQKYRIRQSSFDDVLILNKQESDATL